jgi:cytochrome b561
MAEKKTPEHAVAKGYGPIAVALHWAVFLLVVVVGWLGLLHDDWPRETQAAWINRHAILGLILFALVIWRLIYRRMHAPPDLPPDVGEFSRKVSHPAHMLLYALLVVIPILGIVTFIWHGRAFDFGFAQVDFHVKRDKNIFHPTEDWHGWLAYGLFGLAGVHALAALWHHFIKKDEVLRRMIPGLPRMSKAPG